MKGINSGLSLVLTAGLLAGSTIGAAAQDDQADQQASAWVSGSIAWASSCSPATATTEDGRVEERGAGCTGRTVTSDDPRLAGASVLDWNRDIHATEVGRRAIRSMTETIRGDGRGWVCRTQAVLDEAVSFSHTPMLGSDLYTCVGDGDNAGLTALLVVDTRNTGTQRDAFEGLIFAGDAPPAPEPPPAAE